MKSLCDLPACFFFGSNAAGAAAPSSATSANVPSRFCSRLGFALACFAMCGTLAHAARRRTAEPPGQPVQKLIAASIDAQSGIITVGALTYAPRFSMDNGAHIVALDRTTLQLLPNGDQTFQTWIDVNKFLDGIRAGSHADAIIMATSFGYSFYGLTFADMAEALEQFGLEGSTDFQGAFLHFSLIGNGGLQPGQAHVAFYQGLTRTARLVQGYFAKNSQGTYTFIQPDYVRYGIQPDGTIQVGSKSFDVASASGAGCSGGGFHLLAVNALDLSVSANRDFCNVDTDPAALQSLISDLDTYTNRRYRADIVFFTSYGNAFGASPPDEHAWTMPIALKLKDRLAGTPETFFNSTRSDTYSIVGAPALSRFVTEPAHSQETGSVYPGHPSSGLRGVLGRNRHYDYYVPIDADLTGSANLEFYGILALPSAPFPHPSNDAEVAAFQYINNALCGSKDCNARNAYGNLNQPISDYQTRLASLKDPNDPDHDCPTAPGPSTSPFCTVKIQLATEFSDVASARALYGNLKDLWLGSGTNGILSLLTVYQSIKNEVGAAGSAPAKNVGVPILSALLSIGSFAPGIGPVLGITDTVMTFATGLARDADGNQTTELDTTVAKLEDNAARTFNEQAVVIGTQFDLVYQDWSKLDALGKALQSQAPGWTWSSSSTGMILQGMKPAVEQSYYQALLPAVYALGFYVPAGDGWPTDPHNYSAYCGHVTCDFPFGSNYAPYTYPSDPQLYPDPGTQTLWAGNGWWGISRRDSRNTHAPDWGYQYSPPINTFMAHLFLPQAEGGLGVYRPAFFENWLQARIICLPTKDHSHEYEFGGCYWKNATSSLETPPLSTAGLSITPGDIKRDGTRATVTLRISNSGPLQVDDLYLTRISVRALEWSRDTSAQDAERCGQVSIDNPGLPLRLGALAPGGHTAMVLHLEIPSCVTEVSITERGKLKTAASDDWQKFRLRQRADSD
ncbi:MAG: hypothetical protein ACR2JE_17435 [Acidobacteriaceae bacterium]